MREQLRPNLTRIMSHHSRGYGERWSGPQPQGRQLVCSSAHVRDVRTSNNCLERASRQRAGGIRVPNCLTVGHALSQASRLPTKACNPGGAHLRAT